MLKQLYLDKKALEVPRLNFISKINLINESRSDSGLIAIAPPEKSYFREA